MIRISEKKIINFTPKEKILNLKFGKLTVQKFDGRYEITTQNKIYRENRYLCKCECGNITIVSSRFLKENRGRPKSCGCSRPAKYESSFKYFLASYICRAKKDNLIFELTNDEFKALIFGNCIYCGSTPKNEIKDSGKNTFNGAIIVNGIDRIDSNIGYISKNCVTCCKICNYAKRDMPLNEFIIWIQNLINYRSHLYNG